MTRTELKTLAKRAYCSRYGARMFGDKAFRYAWMLGWASGYRARLKAATKRRARSASEKL